MIVDTETLYKKALALDEQARRTKALTIYSQLTASSNDPRFFIAYGVCLQKLCRWEQSATQLEKGISLKPHYCEGDARLFLAESYIQIGKKAKAIEQWKIVEKMKSEYPSYEHAQNEARKMLGMYE